jgi:hypothetical protein
VYFLYSESSCAIQKQKNPGENMSDSSIKDVEDFKEGMKFFKAGNFEVAGVFFSDLLESEAILDEDVRLCRSWLGLSQVMGGEKDGVVHCRIAAKDGRPPLQIFLNLARAELACGNREKLMQAVEQGLSQYPKMPLLLELHEKYDRREPSVLPFLDRENPCNRWLGRVKKRLSSSLASAEGQNMVSSALESARQSPRR